MNRIGNVSLPTSEKGWGTRAYQKLVSSALVDLFRIGPKCGYVTVRIYGSREDPIYEVFIKHPNEKVEYLSGIKKLDLKKIIKKNCSKFEQNPYACDLKCIKNCSIHIYDYIALREHEESIGRNKIVF